MGFESQEDAERWAEAAEFRAEQIKEERMLKIKSVEAPTSSSSKQTIETIADLLKSKAVDPLDALNAAYTLGKFDGKMAMAKVGTK